MSSAPRPEAPKSVQPPQPLSEDVYELLIEKLLDPACQPGSALNIDRLAETWQVSPTPVREALSRAAATGLVIHRQHYGYRVAPLLPAEDYQALMDARALVEPFCAERAAVLATDQELDDLDQFQQTMERTPIGPTARQYRPYLHADISLHRGIVACARNRFLVQAFDSFNIHFFRFQRFGGGAVADASQSHIEHRAILAALRSRDPQAAATAMARHIEGVRNRA